MINTKQAKRLKYLVGELSAAVRADEMKGSQSPLDMELIETELRMATSALQTFVASITADKDSVATPVSIAQAQAMKAVAEDYLARRQMS